MVGGWKSEGQKRLSFPSFVLGWRGEKVEGLFFFFFFFFVEKKNGRINIKFIQIYSNTPIRLKKTYYYF